jgi:hypothetical protein
VVILEKPSTFVVKIAKISLFSRNKSASATRQTNRLLSCRVGPEGEVRTGEAESERQTGRAGQTRERGRIIERGQIYVPAFFLPSYFLEVEIVKW